MRTESCFEEAVVIAQRASSNREAGRASRMREYLSCPIALVVKRSLQLTPEARAFFARASARLDHAQALGCASVIVRADEIIGAVQGRTGWPSSQGSEGRSPRRSRPEREKLCPIAWLRLGRAGGHLRERERVVVEAKVYLSMALLIPFGYLHRHSHQLLVAFARSDEDHRMDSQGVRPCLRRRPCCVWGLPFKSRAIGRKKRAACGIGLSMTRHV